MDYLPQGITGVMLPVYIQDLSSPVGGGITGLTPNSIGMSGYYYRDTANSLVSFPFVSGVLGTYIASGIVPVDNLLAPGDYVICPPNAAFASGAKFVTINVYGANNMLPVKMKFFLGDAPLTYLAPGAITRNTYSSLNELTNAPSFPANPSDILIWLAMRAANQSVTTSNPSGSGGQDIVYNSSSVPVGSAVFTDSGASFTRNRYI
jgi:hypothetical protein